MVIFIMLLYYCKAATELLSQVSRVFSTSQQSFYLEMAEGKMTFMKVIVPQAIASQ